MLILSNGLCEKADEGFLKVANSLVKRIKKANPNVTVVSYERESHLTDHYLKLNKLLISGRLLSLLRSNNGSVLYIPFPAKTIATALRIFILSLMQKGRLDVILVMKSPMNHLAKALIKFSGAKIIVLSKDAQIFWADIVGENNVTYLKTGVETKKFTPVTNEQAKQLKTKYGFDSNKPVILHVGHLNQGRNIAHLKNINTDYQILLVTSTLTKDEQDTELKNQLLECKNIKIIDSYIPNIQEIYQLSDVYFFPVKEAAHCIDVPLSCMEAAACNKPIITTDYGEMAEFKGKDGFFFIENFKKDYLNNLIAQAIEANASTRQAVLEYDWDKATIKLANGEY